jgi:hypothetical protein
MLLVHRYFANSVAVPRRSFLVSQERMVYVEAYNRSDFFKRELKRIASVVLKMLP